jgi:hypothetical protein
VALRLLGPLASGKLRPSVTKRPLQFVEIMNNGIINRFQLARLGANRSGSAKTNKETHNEESRKQG